MVTGHADRTRRPDIELSFTSYPPVSPSPPTWRSCLTNISFTSYVALLPHQYVQRVDFRHQFALHNRFCLKMDIYRACQRDGPLYAECLFCSSFFSGPRDSGGPDL